MTVHQSGRPLGWGQGWRLREETGQWERGQSQWQSRREGKSGSARTFSLQVVLQEVLLVVILPLKHLIHMRLMPHESLAHCHTHTCALQADAGVCMELRSPMVACRLTVQTEHFRLWLSFTTFNIQIGHSSLDRENYQLLDSRTWLHAGIMGQFSMIL